MIIDIHAHTSDRKLWDLHTDSATITDLEKLSKKFSVRKIVLLATYFPFKKTGLNNSDLYLKIENNNLFLMFASLDMSNNFQRGFRLLSWLVKNKIAQGIKLYPGYQEFEPWDRKYFIVYQLAEENNIPVMCHTGELHHCCPQAERDNGNFRCGDYCKIDTLRHLAEPKAFEAAVSFFPKVKFILSHLGNPYFQQLRSLMHQYPNVYTDISGQFLSGTKEDTPAYRLELRNELIEFLELPNGLERIMFGTDFPIQSYQDSIDLVKSLPLNPEEEEKIFWQNACQVLNLNKTSLS